MKTYLVVIKLKDGDFLEYCEVMATDADDAIAQVADEDSNNSYTVVAVYLQVRVMLE